MHDSLDLEALASDGTPTPERLEPFLSAYLCQVGTLEALCCRRAYRLGREADDTVFELPWVELNLQFAALRPQRESREASAIPGRCFRRLVLQFEDHPRLRHTLVIVIARIYLK